MNNMGVNYKYRITASDITADDFDSHLKSLICLTVLMANYMIAVNPKLCI
jgi:hypothetical protein